jgi:WD40 repeat protein
MVRNNAAKREKSGLYGTYFIRMWRHIAAWAARVCLFGLFCVAACRWGTEFVAYGLIGFSALAGSLYPCRLRTVTFVNGVIGALGGLAAAFIFLIVLEVRSLYYLTDLPHWAGALVFSSAFGGCLSLAVILVRTLASAVTTSSLTAGDWSRLSREMLRSLGVLAMVIGLGELLCFDIRPHLRPARSLQGHSEAVLAVAFSPDARLLATAGEDGLIQIHDVLTGDQILRFEVPGLHLYAVAFSPDGATLATGGGKGDVRLWSLAERRLLSAIPGHPAEVRAVAFSNDGKTLASAGSPEYSGPTTVLLHDVATLREMRRHTTEYQGGSALSFCPGFDELMVQQRWGIAFLHGQSLNQIRYVDLGPQRIEAVAYSPDGETVVTGGKLETWTPQEASDSGAITFWDRRTMAQKSLITTTGWPVKSIAFSPDGSLLGSANGYSKYVRLWDTRRLKEKSLAKGLLAPANAVSISTDGRWLAGGDELGRLRVWDLTTLGCRE